MKISELIQSLEDRKEKHGDVPVYVCTTGHTWAHPVIGIVDGEGRFSDPKSTVILEVY